MLVPLLELAPRARDPRDGTSLAAALPAVTARQIVRRAWAPKTPGGARRPPPAQAPSPRRRSGAKDRA